jgi:hypothetical protein
MTSTYTTNKVLELPANGDYVDTWNIPANGDFNIIDQAFGGSTSLNATSGSATLSAAQYRSLFLNISGAISAAVTYTIPSGVGGQWIVYNSTTDSSGGPWSITIASAGGGTSVIIPRSTRIMFVCDGTNVRFMNYITDNGTVTGNLAVSGNISAGGTIFAASTITSNSSVSDNIGNLRVVPANSQTGSYTLQATDSGKYISITTGGVTVPSGVFSVGQTISIFNNSTSNQTITQGSGATMTQAGSILTGDRTLANYGLCTILCTASNTFVITGAGLS